MVTESDLVAIAIGIGVGLGLGGLLASIFRRGAIGRTTFLLLAPILVLVPISWPLAGVLSLGGVGEQLRCAVVLVLPLSVASWIGARIVGLDLPDGAAPADEEE